MSQHTSTLTQRMRALHRLPLRADGSRGRLPDVVGNDLSERIGIAALHARDGSEKTARAIALLIGAGLADTPRNRAAAIEASDAIAQLLRLAGSEGKAQPRWAVPSHLEVQ